MKIEDAVQKLTESKKRKFVQTVDLIINLKNIDLKKPENKISKDIILPHGRGKKIEVGIISDRIKDAIHKSDIEALSGKAVKEFTEKYDFFICEAPLMPLVGKVLGRYLGPKGKMPKLLPPNAEPEPMIEDANKSIKINVRESPVIHLIVGSESMKPEQIKENVEKTVDELVKALPKGKSQIKSIYLKLTMGKPVRL